MPILISHLRVDVRLGNPESRWDGAWLNIQAAWRLQLENEVTELRTSLAAQNDISGSREGQVAGLQVSRFCLLFACKLPYLANRLLLVSAEYSCAYGRSCFAGVNTSCWTLTWYFGLLSIAGCAGVRATGGRDSAT